MVKSVIYYLFFILFLANSARTQKQMTYPVSKMDRRADSVSMITDSLINAKKFLHLIFQSKYKGDTIKYYRHYFIDTLSRCLVKCILDTTFDDSYKRRFTQTVIYFNQGYEFKNCYKEKIGTNSDICSISNIYPEEYEIAPQIAKLDGNWTKEILDAKMRYYIADEIGTMKIMQKKNYD